MTVDYCKLRSSTVRPRAIPDLPEDGLIQSSGTVMTVTTVTPPPAQIADLLVEMTRLDWPTTEAERQSYFDRLNLRDLDTVPHRDDSPDTTVTRLDTALPDVDGTSTMSRHEFLGLSLFCYNEPIENGAAARAGYAALRDELSRTFGEPTEEWGTPTEPACLWEIGPLWIEMYCFQRLRSGVMVGPAHAQRSAANDAAHAARRP